MSSIEVYLIRHGKTICNEKRLYCGKTDVSLSEQGIKELKTLKSIMRYPRCNKYFTSGAVRAIEYDFGDFEMKSYEDLKENKLYINWIMDEIGYVRCPNGESKNQYKKRIKKEFINFIEAINSNGYESVLLISHGGTIGTILECFYDDSKNFYSWQPKCGEGYKIIIEFENNNFIIKEVLEIKS